MEQLKVTSPYDGHLIKEIPISDYETGEKMLQEAYRIFKDPQKEIPKYQRIEIFEKTAQIMNQRVEELTKTAAEEGGKPYKDTKAEVLRAINGVKLAAEHIGQIKGEEIPMGLTKASEGRLAFTIREPIGPVFSISAFNHPLNLTVHQTVPAIAAGCPVIIKPATSTPLSAIKFINILYEAGLPQEWAKYIVCKSSTAEKLVTDPRVSFMSFIGSAKIGWYLQSKLSDGTRYALEHGGVAPVIVEQDANFDDALPLIAKGGFYHAGQVCVSVQRVYVHESRSREFADRLAETASRLKTGDPLDPDTDVGPLIAPYETDRVEEWAEEARKTKAEILTGGKRINDFSFEPTVIYNPPEDIKISTEEVFGPVVCVYSYKNLDEAVERTNRLPFAFQSAVFTKNIDAALKCTKNMNASSVMVNDHTAFRVDWMPFGGRDISGYGMGGIPDSMHDMTREKLMVFRSPSL